MWRGLQLLKKRVSERASGFRTATCICGISLTRLCYPTSTEPAPTAQDVFLVERFTQAFSFSSFTTSARIDQLSSPLVNSPLLGDPLFHLQPIVPTTNAHPHQASLTLLEPIPIGFPAHFAFDMMAVFVVGGEGAIVAALMCSLDMLYGLLYRTLLVHRLSLCIGLRIGTSLRTFCENATLWLPLMRSCGWHEVRRELASTLKQPAGVPFTTITCPPF